MPSPAPELTFGAFVPYIIPRAVDRDTFLAWCRRIDAGPFHALGHGERTRWHTLEHFTALAAMAVATERVRLWSHVVNVPMHPVAFLAKRTATIDVLSGGRYTMTAGIGGRPQDWLASEKPYVRYPHARMDGQIAELRRMWRGAPPADGGEPVLPLPAQAGGPPILCSSQGPKGLARAARWADGYAGFISERVSDPDHALGGAPRGRGGSRRWLQPADLHPHQRRHRRARPADHGPRQAGRRQFGGSGTSSAMNRMCSRSYSSARSGWAAARCCLPRVWEALNQPSPDVAGITHRPG